MTFGLIKYNNNSISSVTSTASLGSGKHVLIKTQDASSSSSISFVHGTSSVVFDSTYPIYIFKWINIHCSQQSGDGEEFQFNVSTDSGSNYNVAKTTTYYSATHNENDGGYSVAYRTSHDLANGTGYQNLSVDNDADNDASNSGQMFIFEPASTSFVKHFIARNVYMHSTPHPQDVGAFGYINTTSAINAIKFQFNAGTIQSGTIKLYGIADS